MISMEIDTFQQFNITQNTKKEELKSISTNGPFASVSSYRVTTFYPLQ